MDLESTITEQTKVLLGNQNIFPIIYLDGILVAPDQYTSMSQDGLNNLDFITGYLIDYAISSGILNPSHIERLESLPSAEGFFLLKVNLDKDTLQGITKKIQEFKTIDQVEEHLRVLPKLLKKLPRKVSDDYIQQLIKEYNDQTL